MEDKLDCLGVLPSLQHQLTNAEGAIQKLSALAPALESLQKVDFDALKTTMLGITKQIEGSYAATKDGVIANVKEQVGSISKQLLERMGNARETALENFQKLSTMHGESTALIKSHSMLLQGHRAKLLEFEESLALLKHRGDDHNEAMQALEERQAELQESHQRALDKLDAILELLQSVRDHQTSRPPFRAPPIPSGGKGGLPQ